MIFAYAPIVAVLLGVTNIPVPWDTLVFSVVLYVLVPLVAGYITRKALIARAHNVAAVDEFTAKLKPASIAGLLATVVLLFGFQGDVILAKPLLILLIAIPLLLQSYGIFALAYAVAWRMKVPFRIAAPLRADRHVQLLRAGRGRRHRGCSALILVPPSPRWWACWWKCPSCCRWWPWPTAPNNFSLDNVTMTNQNPDLPNLAAEQLHPIDTDKLFAAQPSHPVQVLMLYGSLRQRSFSRLLTEEAARILTALGAEVKLFDPQGPATGG